jgi:ABC-type Mn2+/Zn2+ transport system permease subunit
MGLALSAAFAVLATWGGLAFGYVLPSVPPSSMIISLAFLIYLAAGLRGVLRPENPKLESVS